MIGLLDIYLFKSWALFKIIIVIKMCVLGITSVSFNSMTQFKYYVFGTSWFKIYFANICIAFSLKRIYFEIAIIIVHTHIWLHLICPYYYYNCLNVSCSCPSQLIPSHQLIIFALGNTSLLHFKLTLSASNVQHSRYFGAIWQPCYW
jgi:hypothetical protein